MKEFFFIIMSSSMEDIEHFIKIVQQKKLIAQRRLERPDVDFREKLTKELRELKSTSFFSILRYIIILHRI